MNRLTPRGFPATAFNAVTVNDSNYRLTFTFLRRAAEERGWSVVYSGEVEPQELIDLAQYTHETLGSIERVAPSGRGIQERQTFYAQGSDKRGQED